MREPLPAHKRAEILVRVPPAGPPPRGGRQAISDEAGKPLKAAKVEAARAMSTFTFAAVEARSSRARWCRWTRRRPAQASSPYARQPIGVVGAISPFNFPLSLVAHKLAPALAAGCAVVLKPASQTPFSALLLAELLTEPACRRAG